MGVVLRACYSSPWTWKQEAQKFKDNLGYIRSCSYFVLKRGAGGSCPENADIEFICGEPELCPHMRMCTICVQTGTYSSSDIGHFLVMETLNIPSSFL